MTDGTAYQAQDSIFEPNVLRAVAPPLGIDWYREVALPPILLIHLRVDEEETC